ncbi:MAG: DUF805 domain-containing protein [Asticcacaulis sp.]|nr:DUF805 domain-containing protein [Asticcacaulis sp.]
MVVAAKAPFRFWSFFFSLNGRVSRAAFAWFNLPSVILFTIVPIGAGFFQMRHSKAALGAYVFVAVNGVVRLLLLWPSFATLVKRGHDSGFPWPYGLLAWLAPVLSMLLLYWASSPSLSPPAHNLLMLLRDMANFGVYWLVVLFGCLLPARSTGDRYGPDPRRSAAAAPDLF